MTGTVDEPDRSVLLLGATRGLGLGLWNCFSRDGYPVVAVGRNTAGRTRFPPGTMVAANLIDSVEFAEVQRIVREQSFGCVVYIAGIWESQPFLNVPGDEIDHIVQTNLVVPLHISQALLARIQPGDRPVHFILIGSTCGLDNEGTSMCTYAASKFGLRGLAQSLRQCARTRPLHVTCLSPGSIQDPEVAVESQGARRIPVEDIYQIIRVISSLSEATLIKEVVVPAMDDTDI